MITYLNLTNGLEKYNKREEFRFIRIQSTHIEGKQWDRILQQLDSDFLFNLAVGEECVIVDGNRKANPKTIKIGVPMLRYILTRNWLIKKIRINGFDSNYLDYIYRSLSPNTRSKLKYFRKFVNTDNLRLVGYGFWTNKDGKYDYFSKLVRGEKNAK